jgi:hypothetical protein
MNPDNRSTLAGVSTFTIASNGFGDSIESPAVLLRRYSWFFPPTLEACQLSVRPVLDTVGGMAPMHPSATPTATPCTSWNKKRRGRSAS